VAPEELYKMKNTQQNLHKLCVINTPVDLDHLPEVHTTSKQSDLNKNKDPTLGIIGRISYEKGHTYLIQAMPKILDRFPTTRLLIVGSGPAETALRELVDTLKLSHCVEFTGYIPHSSIFAQWSRMDIAIVPSLNDARPIVALEAMVMGLPVVGTDMGGISEVVLDGKTGLIIPSRNANALAQAIQYLLSYPREAIAMGQRGRQRAFQEFHPARFIEAHERIYEHLATSHAHELRLIEQ
jgi:glycosyltransferase involved in cell wall biosynthesis